MIDLVSKGLAKKLAEAFAEGRGYSVELGYGPLSFVPGFIVEGLPPGSILVCQPGKASVLLDDPSHFNKFVFVKAGFSTEVGVYATSIIKALVASSTGSEYPLLERHDT